MAAVQQRVLNWLYSVLTSEYRDVNRTYGDVARSLSHYSSLSPRTDVYTYENGASALLLQLSGTLPVTFRETIYRFPISLWVPHAYPQEAPMVYVTPSEGIVVRAGQHVDPQGRIYHPYLVGWGEYWDKSNILDFLAILRDVFAKEPPVVARQQQNAQLPPQSRAIPPPVPPLPSDIRSETRPSSAGQGKPPPPPPKQQQSSGAQSDLSMPAARSPDGGPPLPPLPAKGGHESSSKALPSSQTISNPSWSHHQPQRSSSLRYESGPQLPPQPSVQQYDPRRAYVSSTTQNSPSPWIQDQPPTQYANGPPQYYQTSPRDGQRPQQNLHQQAPQPTPRGNIDPRSGMQQSQSPQIIQQSFKPPPVDLLDAPLTLTFPSGNSTPLPAPPIPPNPEKDMLLHTLAKTLYQQRQHSAAQTRSTLPGLHAQYTAMLAAMQPMQDELRSLAALQSLLDSNTAILHTALRSADTVIQRNASRAPPAIDEILVAPTVVGNQLYDVVNEERALGDAIFVLGKAVQRGRIGTSAFVKSTRGLAREWFLKKALAKKIARGMGLSEG